MGGASSVIPLPNPPSFCHAQTDRFPLGSVCHPVTPYHIDPEQPDPSYPVPCDGKIPSNIQSEIMRNLPNHARRLSMRAPRTASCTSMRVHLPDVMLHRPARAASPAGSTSASIPISASVRLIAKGLRAQLTCGTELALMKLYPVLSDASNDPPASALCILPIVHRWHLVPDPNSISPRAATQ
ncbi:hypothetical protein OBBRIDRAFT_526903 [Obba rivulosa]|uniref:Uncharacterized protein n=1 Tax=Obba rivulosa TaxID=1052685 RepID=A0A8E2DMR8_9APHY|nr:hypothetical protein OBBRIDRAFT_526903 [Obba rivulosa]